MKKIQFIFALVLVLAVYPATQAYANWWLPPEFPSIHLYGDAEVLTDRETWFAGSVTIIDPNNPANNTLEAVADVRGRGNSTWRYGEQKRPLRFRFPEPENVLHFEHEARTWLLLADLFDLSLMRNFAGFHFSNMLDSMYFTPIHQHVHVYFNGQYMGVYLLTDERDIGDGRLNITIDSDPALSEFVLERDRRVQRTERPYLDFVIAYGVAYDIRFPSGSAFRSYEQGQYVQAFLENVSRVIRSRDFDAISAVIDVNSFVDYYIVLELFRDPDSGFSSLFMQILGQGDDRRLVKGPVWDFDMSAGNVRGARPEGVLAASRNYWFYHLIQVPAFRALVADRWNSLVDNEFAQTLVTMADLADTYAQEFERNFDLHQILTTGYGGLSRNQTHTSGLRNNPAVLAIDTHAGQVEFLIDFLTTRATWFTEFLNADELPSLSLTDRDFNIGTTDEYELSTDELDVLVEELYED